MESGFTEKPGIEPATPGLQVVGLSPTPQKLISNLQSLQLQKLFVAFLGINQCNWVSLRFVSWFLYQENPKVPR